MVDTIHDAITVLGSNGLIGNICSVFLTRVIDIFFPHGVDDINCCKRAGKGPVACLSRFVRRGPTAEDSAQLKAHRPKLPTHHTPPKTHIYKYTTGESIFWQDTLPYPYYFISLYSLSPSNWPIS